MQSVDECLTGVEMHVEGALRHPGPGNHAVDAEAGEPVLFGDRHSGVEQGVARAVPGCCDCLRWHLHEAT